METSTSYDDYLARQKAERAQLAQEETQLAQFIASDLDSYFHKSGWPKGWAVRPQTDDDAYYRWTYVDYLPKCPTSGSGVTGACGIDLNRTTQGRKSFWHIGIDCVRDAQGDMHKVEGDFSINVTTTKTPAQISADIRRRILRAGYFTAYDKAVESAQRANAYKDEKWAATLALGRIIGHEFRERETEERSAQIHWYGRDSGIGSGECRVNSADSFDFKIGCNKALATAILELIASRKPQQAA
jgi:hypothetical protein